MGMGIHLFLLPRRSISYLLDNLINNVLFQCESIEITGELYTIEYSVQ